MELARIQNALTQAQLPPELVASIQAKLKAESEPFLRSLAAVMKDDSADSMLLASIDKSKALPDGYAPKDLVALAGTGLSLSRPDHRLRKAAFEALKSMDAAARKDGIVLVVASSYRSYEYQIEVWNRSVKSDGLAETEASVAQPGHSQHQLGMAIDFGPISDAFAKTKASAWLESNAARFGFSLSFPRNLTAVTGYKWESWHYRFIGKSAAALAADYFGGVQHYLLQFVDAYRAARN